MDEELEDTLDAMVNTIEGISKALADTVKCLEDLDKRITTLELPDSLPSIHEPPPGIRGGRL